MSRHGIATNNVCSCWGGWVRHRALAGGITIFALAGAGEAQVVTVFREGQQALGANAGIRYASFGFPVISPDGTIAVDAFVSSSPNGIPSTEISYVGRPGAFSVLARQGNPAVGAAPGVNIVSPNPDEVANGGFAVGVDSVLGGGIGNQGIFAGTPGQYICYASEGQSAPGGGNYTGNFFPPSVNAAHQFTFLGGTTGPLDAIYLASGGQVSSVAAIGQPVQPGSALNFTRFHSMPVLSDSGHVIFAATASVPSAYSVEGIWSGTPGALQQLVSTQTAAPGTNNAIFSSVGEASPSINRAGRFAFRGGLSDVGPVNNTNDTGIWSDVSGSLMLVARQGDQAPGLPAGTSFKSFGPYGNLPSPVLNDAGEIAFAAGLAGDGNVGAGLFAGTPGHVAPIFLAGQHVPGVPASITLNDAYNVHLNQWGQIVFMADMSGPGVVAPGTSALIAYDPIVGLRAIAVPGVVLSGVGEPPTAVIMVGDNSGYLPDSLSDTGMVVFSALFPDGYRVLEAVVPEPSMLLWPFGMGLLYRRRRGK